MAEVATDLITKFSFEGSIEPLTKYNKSLGVSVKALSVMTAGIVAGASAMAAWVTGISRSQDANSNLAKNIGVSVEAMNELSYAAEVNGSSQQAMESSLSSLSSKIGEASINGSDDFARLGISIRDTQGNLKTADQVMLEFVKRTRQMNLTAAQKQSLAERLGIDKSLVQLLSLSVDKIDKFRKKAIELGRPTQKQANLMMQYNDTLVTMNKAWEGFKVQMAVGIIPQLQELAKSFTGWILDNKDVIVNGIKVVADFVDHLAQSFKRMAPVIAVVTAGFIGLKVATLGLSGSLAILFSPVIVAVGVITGLYLIVDDLITAFKGGKSVIADFFKDTFDIDIVKGMTKAFNVLMKNGIDPLIESVKQLWSYFTDIGKWMISTGKGVMNFLGFSSDKQPAISPKVTAKIGAGSGGKTTIHQDVKIEVKSNDPAMAARMTKDALHQQVKDAYYQSGGKY